MFFTFIAEYDGGTYIGQTHGSTVAEALEMWNRSADSKEARKTDPKTPRQAP